MNKNNLGGLWSSNLPIWGKMIRTPLRFVPDSTCLKIWSGINKGYKWIVGSGIHQCWLGVYEKDKQVAIREAIKSGMTVWDIGANVGFYTLAFSRCVGPNGRVVAFEPSGANVAYLIDHISMNSIFNVQIVQVAISDFNGFIYFSAGVDSSVGKIEPRGIYQIPSISVDQIISYGNVPSPDLIKIDIEGAEAAMLKGAEILLRERGPELWLALHGERAMRDCGVILKEYGYRIFNLDGTELLIINTEEIIAKKIFLEKSLRTEVALKRRLYTIVCRIIGIFFSIRIDSNIPVLFCA